MLLNFDSADGEISVPLQAGENTVRATVTSLALAPGRYRLGLRLANPVTTRIGSGAIDLLDPALVLQVDEGPMERSPALVTAGRDRDTAPRLIAQGAGSLVQGAATIEVL